MRIRFPQPAKALGPPATGRWSRRRGLPRAVAPAWFTAAVLTLALGAGAAPAMVRFDFETPYLVHPGLQVWDFCLIRHEGTYHAFYHTVPPEDLIPVDADTIWHAVSADLARWEIVGPAVAAGPQWWDAVAVWAPDVVYDEVGGRWAMLYTGVAAGMVQRACLAWSPDLQTWTKSEANPVFEPDSLIYHWSPSQAWSSFRDPFVYHDGTQWNMLSTAALRLGVYPGYRRGIVHRAVSDDLENWQDAGVFYEHDGVDGMTHDLESVQYVVRGGWHHLFFVEADPDIAYHPTSHMVASAPAGWTMAERTYVAMGWAPEVERFDETAGADVFGRLVKDFNPLDGTWFIAAKFDSVRFELDGRSPVVFAGDRLGADWPVRSGAAAAAAPTFGDNPTLRGDEPAGLQGNSWFGSREYYGGPLSGVGYPGGSLGDNAVSYLQSRPFVLQGGHFQLLLGGGDYPATLYVALLDDATGDVLSRIYPTGSPTMVERIWDVRDHVGRTVRLGLFDQESGAQGWIAVDAIEEREGVVAVGGDGPGERVAPTAIGGLRAGPNPLNGGTILEFSVTAPGTGRVEIFDARGRRVWSAPVTATQPGPVRLAWNGRDGGGRELPSGAYLCRVLYGGESFSGLRLTIVR